MNTPWPSAQYFARFGSCAANSGYDCFWQILLQKSKIEQPEKSRES